MKRGRKEKIYAVYKGEEMEASGTLRECAEKLGLAVRTLRFYCTPTHRKRCRGNNHREVFSLDD